MVYSKLFPFLRNVLRMLVVVTILSLVCIELASAQSSSETADNIDPPSTDQSRLLNGVPMSLVGEGSFKVAFWKIYDVQLLAPNNLYSPDSPFALELTYSRKLKGELVAKKCIELIRHQGIDDEELLARWEQELFLLIPSVDKGDVLLGIKTDLGMEIYFNNELISSTDDRQLANYFFNIWLGEDTTAPRLRKKLLG